MGTRAGVYYNVLREGTGSSVSVTDTITVFYKGYLLKDGTVFDQTYEKPATFPLSRLIKGWQLGLTQAKLGSKIQLIIPSGLAYSIRSRSQLIPPNSVLVFEIELLSLKTKIEN
jgi:FKBP-type peptidyl-prolyl cis-trans isomerase